MSITLTITIQETETGIDTGIHAEGPCSKAESEYATFIYKSIIDVMSHRPGYKKIGDDICKVIQLNKGNKNVH
ncbi:MAG: hypothetical protein RR896_04235 [Citrobacter sp.]|uniref:hypothetical protein n=1 Tax=Citrobacter sp. TaxID=1896336 RepID=UPI002FCB9F0B